MGSMAEGRFDELFQEVFTPGDNPEKVVDRLSVESVIREGLSEHLYPLLVKFRHLNQSDRNQAARSYISRLDTSRPA